MVDVVIAVIVELVLSTEVVSITVEVVMISVVVEVVFSVVDAIVVVILFSEVETIQLCPFTKSIVSVPVPGYLG